MRKKKRRKRPQQMLLVNNHDWVSHLAKFFPAMFLLAKEVIEWLRRH